MPGSSWTVVKFNDENSVEAVPISWIFNKRCYWPSFQRDKVVAAIRKNEEPNTHWPSYEVTIFRNSTYENYITAREKCKKAENTSDLNSEISADEERKQRKIIKRQFSSSEDEEYNYRSLPTPPPLKDNYKASENKIDEEVVQSYDARNKIIAKQVYSEESFLYTPSLRKPHRMKEMLETAGKQVAAPLDHFKNNAVNPGIENTFLLTSPVKCTCQLCPTHAQMQNKNEIYFKEIIRQQNYFKAQLWQTSEDIRDIKNAGLNQAPSNGIQRQESVFCSFTLPLETEQQLEEVEQFLRNQANFKTSVTQASRTGGKHSYEFMKRNLSQLLSNKLAEKFSWLGKKHKQKFHELKLTEMLIAAGEVYNESFTKKDLEESIKKWLRRAKERSDADEKKLASQEVLNNRI